MAIDVVSLVGNRRLTWAAVIPPCVVFAVAMTGTPVQWPYAWLPALLVVLILVINAARQVRMDKPRKVWRIDPWLTFGFDLAALVVGILGSFYAMRPWEEVFDVISATAIGVGAALSASVICLVTAPLAFAEARRYEGPFKHISGTGKRIGTILASVFFAGPVVGYFGSIPAQFLYIEEVASANPSFMSRHTWLLVMTLGLVTPFCVLWARHDLKRQLAKQERAS